MVAMAIALRVYPTVAVAILRVTPATAEWAHRHAVWECLQKRHVRQTHAPEPTRKMVAMAIAPRLYRTAAVVILHATPATPEWAHRHAVWERFQRQCVTRHPAQTSLAVQARCIHALVEKQSQQQQYAKAT